MHLKPLSIYETTDYFRELTALVAAATPGSRIALMSMSFDPDERHVHTLMHELTAAAQRGVQVHLLIDAISFATNSHELPTGPIMLLRDISTSRQPYFHLKYKLLEELHAQGGHYRIINVPKRQFTLPYVGRSHIKIAIINNTVFAGGCNLNSDQIDYMVRFEDPTQADWLYELVTQVTKIGNVGAALRYTDREIALDARTTIFVDAGKPKQSIIYKNALDFIDSAQEWLVMTCQYFPNTVTAKHLAAAVKRGVNVVLYYNHPSHHAEIMQPVQRAVIWIERSRQPHELFAYQLPKSLQRLHAKLIASEQGAMIGSHNYVTHGVNFGTAEIAIRRRDPTFAHDALAVLQQYLPPSHSKPLQKLTH